MAASIKALFILSSQAFDWLHNDTILCCTTLVLEVIKAMATDK